MKEYLFENGVGAQRTLLDVPMRWKRRTIGIPNRVTKRGGGGGLVVVDGVAVDMSGCGGPSAEV